MPRLDLSPQEMESLARVLRLYQSDLRMEIADTDRMSFREKLKSEEAILKEVAQKLADALQIAPEPAAKE